MPPPEEQAANGDGQRRGRRAYHGERPIQFEQIEVRIHVMLGGNRIENEVEAARMFLHLRFVLRDHNFVGAEAQRVGSFVRGGREQHHIAPKAFANFTPMCPSPPSPTMPTFWPLPTFQWRSGE